MSEKMKKAGTLILLLWMMLGLCSCRGKLKMRTKNGDGTVTEIVCENHSILSRTPVFTREEDRITMQFNGRNWYEVRTAGPREAEEIASAELLAKSTNVRVFRDEEDSDYGYLYLIDLEGSEEAFIVVRSTDAPEEPGYGCDFSYCISYAVDGEETVPDLEWELCGGAE